MEIERIIMSILKEWNKTFYPGIRTAALVEKLLPWKHTIDSGLAGQLRHRNQLRSSKLRLLLPIRTRTIKLKIRKWIIPSEECCCRAIEAQSQHPVKDKGNLSQGLTPESV